MGSKMKKIYGLFLVSTLVSCNQSIKTQSVTAREQAEIEANKESFRNSEQEQISRLDKIQSDVDRSKVSTANVLAPGGQPGNITLQGPFLTDDKLDNRVFLSSLPGKSWKGIRPELDPKTVVIKNTLPETTQTSLKEITTNSTYINLGCELSTYAGIKDLTEQKPVFTENSFLTLKAKVILVCSNGLALGSQVSLLADTIYLSGVKYQMTGFSEKGITISANELVLFGSSSISSVAEDNSYTLLQGPFISISTNNLKGNGSLNITADGANYVGDKEQTQQNGIKESLSGL